jgi:hypothetical protein
MGPKWNAAGLHPRFGEAEDYFRSWAALRAQLLERLQRTLGCGHRLFLVQNTTQALLILLSWCGGRGFLPVGFVGVPHKYYGRYLTRAGLAIRGEKDEPRALLVTHLSPLTGEIASLPEFSPTLPIIVDAAQTLGTVLQDVLFQRAVLFAAPLHKHLGIATGLGILGVDMKRLGEPFASEVCALAECAAYGLVDRRLLQEACASLSACGISLPLNTITISVGDRLALLADRLGCDLLTPSGLQGHTVSFQCRDEAAVARASRIATNVGRYFAKGSILRISLHSAEVGGLSPAEAEEAICLEVDKAMMHGESVPSHAI